MLTDTFTELPLPYVLLITITVVLASIELGYQIGARRKHHKEFESEAQLSAITGANLALLAFMLAFSFSLAASHHGTRKQLILEEANTIGTIHLRAGLVHRAEGEALQQLMVEYADVRSMRDPQYLLNPEALIAESLVLQTAIWQQVELLSQSDDIDVLDGLLVEAINDLFDIHELRVSAGFRNRIPTSIWAVLLFLLTISMLGMGHFSGLRGKRNPVASTTLALSFSAVMYLIADLDRPISGLVTADQATIRELSARLHENDP